MSISEKFEVIADRVYEKGRQDEWSDFWDTIQNNGNRTNYMYAFSYWENLEVLNPKYKIVPTSILANMFYACRKLKKLESKYLDLSQANVLTTTTGSNAYYTTFAYCNALEEIEDIGLKPGGHNLTFIHCYNLKKIAKISVTEECAFITPFARCDSLEDIAFEGVIGQNISFVNSPLLTKKSLNSIIDHLKDFTGTGNKATITLHTDSKTLLGEEGLKRITVKGWEVM